MRRSGYTLVEMVLVMFLLMLVSFYVFSVTGLGSSAYLRLHDWQRQTSDLRIGISYIDVKTRSHDEADAISIRPDPFSGADALVISRDIGSQRYLTWIYVYDGYLYELFIREQGSATPEMGNRIARMDRLEVSMAGSGSLRITLHRQNGASLQTRSRVIRLNSGVIKHE